ncbi:hypothetical protein BKA83DRAFT_4063157, partial [Pisolithus microcarpus]
VVGQLIELAYPTNGAVLHAGKNITVQVKQPLCTICQCGRLALPLAVDHCNNGVCARSTQQLGTVLYARPWTPIRHAQGGFCQTFAVQIDQYVTKGPAVFTLTHFCLLGVRSTLPQRSRNERVT